jgi:acetoin utilization deacetylase AcuC-like enzyme
MDDIVWFYPEGHTDHAYRGHPEAPERVEVIRQALVRQGWWEKYPQLAPIVLSAGLVQSVHTPSYLNLLEMTSRRGGFLDADTYVTPHSWQLAHQAAGGAVAVAEAVWDGHARRGFALCRPPGHHACRGQGMGFCLLNNIALAAEGLIQHKGVHRIAIIDLDLHHGNGTQDIFWERSEVLYISTHQSPLYPGTGRIEETGHGDGEGYTANMPLPPGSGDEAFRTVMGRLIVPLLDRYRPEMLLISYGFDVHWSDPLGHLLLSAQGLRQLFTALASWADQNCSGKISVVLEGGYNLEAAEACTLSAISALLAAEYQDPMGPAPYRETQSWQPILERACRLWGV